MRFQFKPPQAEKPTKAPDIAVVVDVDLLDLYRSAHWRSAHRRSESKAQFSTRGSARLRPRAESERTEALPTPSLVSS